VGAWSRFVGQAGAWLRLARVDRVVAYAESEQEDSGAFLAAVGFRELTRTKRGWVRVRTPPSATSA
jgi:hypothetical protein